MATIQIRELSEEAYETIRRRARAGDAHDPGVRAALLD